jgi:hypothetical protein
MFEYILCKTLYVLSTRWPRLEARNDIVLGPVELLLAVLEELELPGHSEK